MTSPLIFSGALPLPSPVSCRSSGLFSPVALARPVPRTPDFFLGGPVVWRQQAAAFRPRLWEYSSAIGRPGVIPSSSWVAPPFCQGDHLMAPTSSDTLQTARQRVLTSDFFALGYLMLCNLAYPGENDGQKGNSTNHRASTDKAQLRSPESPPPIIGDGICYPSRQRR